MDKQFELFCVADPLFYDSPTHRAGDSDFEVAKADLPPGWRRLVRDLWVAHLPPAPRVPLQGWKIHVSACLDNADEVLARVWDYCRPRQVSFKFLQSRLALHMRNAKYAPRDASGKFITIYPVDDADCERICNELGDILAGQPGPCILSDLRIGAGPLHVRYGGFAERWCDDGTGELATAIEDPSGTLVPDRRDPVFTIPPWVTAPDFLAPHLAQRNAVTTVDLPYHIEQAVHFSNGGGVYLATELASGQEVILKEARPHAGLDGNGEDAVARLTRERDILMRLAGLDVVPNVRATFELGEHHFLVEDLIEGNVLSTFFARSHPYIEPEPDPERIASYTAWALGICERVEAAVSAIHARGVVFNDLHTLNVIVRPDETVALVDFEAAAHVDEGRKPAMGAAGFLAPPDRTGFAVDRYSLACLRLAMFVPLTQLIPLDPAKATQIAGTVAELFPVDRAFLADAVREIAGPQPGTAPPTEPSPRPELTPERAGWEGIREALTRAILASATPARSDRLFPGDINQFAPGGGLNLAYGAAGVIHALSVTGAGRSPQHEEWLLDRIGQPLAGLPLGLYDGLLGVACVLEDLGHRDAALGIAEGALGERWERLGSDLSGGLAGIALACTHLAAATGETALRDAAVRAADIVAARAGAGALEGQGSGNPAERAAGLMQGPAGPALMLIRLYELTGDTAYLDHAAAALRIDLDRCVVDRNGALQLDEGHRVLPYLAKGSAGIGYVLDDYLRHRDDERFAQAAEGATRAACSPYYAQSGLYAGRAGLIAYLSRKHAPGEAAGDPHVAAHIRRLDWHALSYRGGLAFPGDRLSRLSMDLATGTAGVLLALGAVLCAHPVHLPFLGPATDLLRTTSSDCNSASEGGEFTWSFSTSRV